MWWNNHLLLVFFFLSRQCRIDRTTLFWVTQPSLKTLTDILDARSLKESQAIEVLIDCTAEKSYFRTPDVKLHSVAALKPTLIQIDVKTELWISICSFIYIYAYVGCKTDCETYWKLWPSQYPSLRVVDDVLLTLHISSKSRLLQAWENVYVCKAMSCLTLT